MRVLVGIGSEFCGVLPRCESPAASPAVSNVVTEGGASLDGLVVVVIEDDRDVGHAMAKMLQGWQCYPFLFDNVDDASAFLARDGLTPQAIIADYRLPDNRTGVQAIEALRVKYGPVPAVLITGEVNAPELQMTDGFDYPVLRKPIEPGRIRNALLGLVARSNAGQVKAAALPART